MGKIKLSSVEIRKVIILIDSLAGGLFLSWFVIQVLTAWGLLWRNSGWSLIAPQHSLRSGVFPVDKYLQKTLLTTAFSLQVQGTFFFTKFGIRPITAGASCEFPISSSSVCPSVSKKMMFDSRSLEKFKIAKTNKILKTIKQTTKITYRTEQGECYFSTVLMTFIIINVTIVKIKCSAIHVCMK